MNGYPLSDLTVQLISDKYSKRPLKLSGNKNI